MRWFKMGLGYATQIFCIIVAAALYVPLKGSSWAICKLDICFHFAQELVQEQRLVNLKQRGVSMEPRNVAKCKKCGDIIESKHRHDFVWCKCGSIFVDGGRDYWKWGTVGGPEQFERILKSDEE